MKTQFGQVESGDFEENTMTLKVDGEMELRSGKYAIVPIEDYENLNTCSCGFCVKEKEG